ncbi:CoA transferase [Streptomyces sp. NPDC096311]|uniref:CaiB/BaiF CoA-transferase family protein n=1 Tax=Streptomyces sp. NPDC096311 TaxID=3366083 RepID=UPI00380816E6
MGPLDGYLIVDLSERSAAAAIAGMVFADYGARVVRVEPPGGDPVRALPAARVWLRGQESVSEDGLSEAELAQLCRSADVVIDTAQAWSGKSFAYRPPVPERQVYCLLTAEPARADDVAAGVRPAEPVYGELAEAKYGYMYIQDGIREPPVYVGVPHGVFGAAWLIQIGVLGALYARERTGRGQVLTTSLVDALAFLNNHRWLGGGEPPLEAWPNRSTFTRLGDSRMILAMMECADGWIQFNTGAKGASNNFFRLLGREDLVDPQTDLNPYSPFPSHEMADEFWEFMPGEFKKRTVQEWWEALSDAGVSTMPLLDPGEALSLEQALVQGIAHETSDGAQFGLPWRFERTPGRVGAPPAEVGAHNSAHHRPPVRAAARPSEGERQRPSGRGPLDGVTVLDLGVFIQGPLSMRLLADLGARVIKVEETALTGQDIPGHSMGNNRGKESLALDLKSPDGRELVLELAKKADIFHQNQRFGAMDRLGLDYDTVREVNPKLIYCHASGYGNLGPWASLPVFGPMPDALAGAFRRSGGEGNEPVHAVSHADYGAALNGAAGVLAALVERERSGRGQFVETPQFGASMLWICDPYRADGKIVETYPLDAQQRGHAPTNALYRTRDGWLLLACHDEREWAAAQDALGAERRESYVQARGRAFSAEDDNGPLAQAFAALDTAGALACLGEAGVACAEPQFVIPEMLLHTDAAHIGPLVAHRHPVRGEMFDVGRPWRFSAAPDDPPRRPPVPGEHSRAVLHELGIAPQRIEQLLDNGVVAQARTIAAGPLGER